MKAFNKDDQNHVIFAGWLMYMVKEEGCTVQEAFRVVDDVKDDLFPALLEYTDKEEG